MSHDFEKMSRVELERVADAGDAEAQYMLAGLLRGSRFASELVHARKLLTLAAEQGLASAQNDLGAMLLNGMGGPQDMQGAIRRKNCMFAGNETAGKRVVAIVSLIATAKANGIEPRTWLTDVFTRLRATIHRDIDSLMPLAR